MGVKVGHLEGEKQKGESAGASECINPLWVPCWEKCGMQIKLIKIIRANWRQGVRNRTDQYEYVCAWEDVVGEL